MRKLVEIPLISSTRQAIKKVANKSKEVCDRLNISIGAVTCFGMRIIAVFNVRARAELACIQLNFLQTFLHTCNTANIASARLHTKASLIL